MQRNGTTADLTITGSVGTGTHSIEARWNGGAWQTIVVSGSGTYSGVLTNQTNGQGTLEVRYVDQPWQTATMPYVGIGDVFVIAGQSNAVGQGSNNQSYSRSSSGVRACLFGNDYQWHELYDPSDDATSQVDVCSNDGGTLGGSVWPLVASRFLTNFPTVPIAFVPCAKDGSNIDPQWQPSGAFTNRANLFGSMTWRAKYAVGGAKAVLWWQGEFESVSGNPLYYAKMTNLSANISTQIGCKLMPCKLEACDPTACPQEASINTQIGQAWATDTNCLTGPDLNSLPCLPEDTLHLKTDAKLASAAELWWNAIKTAFGW